MINSVLAAVFSLLSVPLGLGAALVLNRTQRLVPVSAFLIPLVLAPAVVGIAYSMFLAPEAGLFWSMLKARLGLDIALLTEERFAFCCVVAAGFSSLVALCAGLLLVALNRINQRTDQVFGIAVWPQLRPWIGVASCLVALLSLHSFDLVAVMTDGGPFGSTRSLSFLFAEQLSEAQGARTGYAGAIAAVQMVVSAPLIAMLILNARRCA